MILTVSLLISAVAAVSLGPVKIGFTDTCRIIAGKLGIIDCLDEYGGSVTAIVWNMRVPRVLLGLFVGAGLSVSGSVMQTTVNNPIAEPYILGISAGATFGATLTIIFGLSSLTAAGAFTGAMAATLAVMIIASIHGKVTTTSIILSGTVVNALFTAFSNFIISVGATADSMMTIKFWTMGSLTSAAWGKIGIPAAVVTAAVLFFLSQYRVFNAMIMGDETAITLGINLKARRFVYMAVIAVITGTLVASCGIIGFVGLIAPHLARGLVGTNYKRLLPIATLLGSLIIIWADVFARILVANAELPIGIFTAVIGAPFFIYIVVKNQKRTGS